MRISKQKYGADHIFVNCLRISNEPRSKPSSLATHLHLLNSLFFVHNFRAILLTLMSILSVKVALWYIHSATLGWSDTILPRMKASPGEINASVWSKYVHVCVSYELVCIGAFEMIIWRGEEASRQGWYLFHEDGVAPLPSATHKNGRTSHTHKQYAKYIACGVLDAPGAFPVHLW